MNTKRRFTFSIALALSIVLASSTSFDRAVDAEGNRFFAYDPGIIKVGTGELLRLTVNAGAGNDAVTVRFRQMAYMQTACDGGVCKLTVSSQSTSAPITLMPGEGAFQDLLVSSFGSLVVLSNSRDLRVNAQIIDAETGQVNSIIAVLIAL